VSPVNSLICEEIRSPDTGDVTDFPYVFRHGSAQDTNQRWKMLLRQGQTGLSTAFDFPTLMGYDSDSPKALGEVGKCGVAIDTWKIFWLLWKAFLWMRLPLP